MRAIQNIACRSKGDQRERFSATDIDHNHLRAQKKSEERSDFLLSVVKCMDS